MKLKTTITRKGDSILSEMLPLGNSFWNAIGEAMILSIVDNVDKQKRYDGSAQKTNAQMTLERKRRLGRPLKSLLDDPTKHRFATPGNYRLTLGNESVTIQLKQTHRAREISRHVQKMGYTGWLRPARGAAKKVFQKLLLIAVRRAKAKVKNKTEVRKG